MLLPRMMGWYKLGAIVQLKNDSNDDNKINNGIFEYVCVKMSLPGHAKNVASRLRKGTLRIIDPQCCRFGGFSWQSSTRIEMTSG